MQLAPLQQLLRMRYFLDTHFHHSLAATKCTTSRRPLTPLRSPADHMQTYGPQCGPPSTVGSQTSGYGTSPELRFKSQNSSHVRPLNSSASVAMSTPASKPTAASPPQDSGSGEGVAWYSLGNVRDTPPQLQRYSSTTLHDPTENEEGRSEEEAPAWKLLNF